MRKVILVTLGLFLSLPMTAQAAKHRHNHHSAYTHHRSAHYVRYHRVKNHRVVHRKPYADGRPAAWCGWYMRQLKGITDTAFDLARNWARWGSPASPGVGVMVVWSHHVGIITGKTAKGEWIVKSGNDGNQVRERPRSIAKAIAFRT